MQDEQQLGRPAGERTFAYLLLLGSLWGVWAAYQISGLGKLSDPGTIPLLGTAIMSISAAINVFNCHRRAATHIAGPFWKDIAPPAVLIFSALTLLYAALFESAGFILSSLIYLLLAFILLARLGIAKALAISVGSLAVIYIIFRMIFLVLLPEGVVPERDIMSAIQDLVAGR